MWAMWGAMHAALRIHPELCDEGTAYLVFHGVYGDEPPPRDPVFSAFHRETDRLFAAFAAEMVAQGSPSPRPRTVKIAAAVLLHLHYEEAHWAAIDLRVVWAFVEAYAGWFEAMLREDAPVLPAFVQFLARSGVVSAEVAARATSFRPSSFPPPAPRNRAERRSAARIARRGR